MSLESIVTVVGNWTLLKRTQNTPSHFLPTQSHFALSENVFTVVSVQRMFHRPTEEGHVCLKIFNNQPFRESALDELEKRKGAGTLFEQSI